MSEEALKLAHELVGCRSFDSLNFDEVKAARIIDCAFRCERNKQREADALLCEVLDHSDCACGVFHASEIRAMIQPE